MSHAHVVEALPVRRRQLVGAAAALLWAVSTRAESTRGTPWFDDEGRASALAWQAIAVLGEAASHGLDPADYAASALHRGLSDIDAGASDTAARERVASRLEVALRTLLDHLHRGRVDPRSIHHDFARERTDGFDAAGALRQALAVGRLDDAVRAAVPPFAQYGLLRAALADHRALAAHPAWHEPLPAQPRKVEPGQAWPGLPVVAARLVAMGDLADGGWGGSQLDDALAVAVRRFQRRHGLADDGVIGTATRRALDKRPATRARQIELALERLRWTPLRQGPRMVVVNIPEFVLRAYELHEGRIVVRTQMKVIVGKALDTRTPLFDEDMRRIEFAPYWNVPLSIARDELVPRLRRDPGYWAREGFEFVTAAGAVVTTLSAAGLDAARSGAWRIRQRPGPHNALGDIKFVFPNRSAIYLHHTPATGLFARDRRDFSHGCIRVEDPVALARFVLDGLPGWDEAAIRAAMQRGQSSTLELPTPLPVLIAYGTTLVKDGRIHFYDDIYGLDRVLDDALRARRATMPPPEGSR